MNHPPGQSGHSLRALDVRYQGRLSSQDDPAHDGVVARRPRKDALNLPQTGGAEPIASGYWPLQAIARANGWILVPGDSEGYPAGAEVVVRALL